MGKLNKHDFDEKKARKLQRRLNALWTIHRSRKLFKLDKPIKHGFVKNWKIRKQDLNRKDAKFRLEALNAVNNEVWSYDGTFLVAITPFSSLVSGHVEYMPSKHGGKFFMNPGIKDLYKNNYEELSDGAKKFFFEEEKVPVWGGPYKIYHLRRDMMYLETEIKQDYITHRYEHLPELDKEYDEINAEIEKLAYAGKAPNWWWNWKDKHDHGADRARWRRERDELLKQEI